MWRVLRQIAKTGIVSEPAPEVDAIQDALARVFDRALAIRHVDAGSCNGCELELHALENPVYNLQGAGVRFVASPRHADLLLVTGPVSSHMVEALKRTYEATPEPKRVVAIGDCAGCGGLFGETNACRGRIANVIPVDVVVPGCPPAPVDVLKGILAVITRRR